MEVGSQASTYDVTAPETAPDKKLGEKTSQRKQGAQEIAGSATLGGTGETTTIKDSKQPQALDYVDQTPKGDKKILGALEEPAYSAYNPRVVESAWYDWWEKEGFFEPEFGPGGAIKPRGAFVIPIPPPNVTGALHCGHALATALQDLLVRWHRMKGFTTLYLPGCDHASISTQSVIENALWRRERKTRLDLGRAEFVRRTLEWKDEYHGKINKVLRRLGGSFDWAREAFTMDENLTEATMETFVRLHDEGYIYRSNRLVNWSVKLNTAVSNLEVENRELSRRTLIEVPGYERKVEFGVIVYFKYPIADSSSEYIEVATTRPETILGDSGIAVHPSDTRYERFVGRKARHPFLGRLLPIVADTCVDPEFGTGAVKITPAHDLNDYALGERHNLESINVLNDDGTMNHNAGQFVGQKRFDVRRAITEELQKLGLFVKKMPNPMKVPLCSKTKDVIEPLVKPQWWMRMRELAGPAIEVVRNGEVKIRPESAEKNYFRWLENINDWCLSRQLWWGHQIPAYNVRFEGEASGDDWVAGKTEEEARRKAEMKFPGKRFQLVRDPDVLDTWFSAGLWPFATLGWPKRTRDLENLFPASVLETGWDILFFWVARMIMLSLKLTGKIPFHEVYCHPLIRDSEGRKMSKSLGNVVDPVDIMEGISLRELQGKLGLGNLDPKELATASRYQKAAFPQGIPECGADALRFTLIQLTTGAGDIALHTKVMAANRRFCNKIYQATKYFLGNLAPTFVPLASPAKTGNESLTERWILHELSVAARELNEALEAREFSRSAQILYHYWYERVCDVFIESSKAILLNGTEAEKASVTNTLYTVLEASLVMIHPFMPFLSEELWHRLPRRADDLTPSVVKAAYPEVESTLQFRDPDAAAEYGIVIACSKGIRSLASEYGIRGDGKAFIHAGSDSTYNITHSELDSIHALSNKKRIASIEVTGPGGPAAAGCAVYVVSKDITVFLEVRGRVGVADLIKKTTSKLQEATSLVVRQKALVASEDWLEKASDTVREMELAKLKDAEAVERNLAASLKQFQKL